MDRNNIYFTYKGYEISIAQHRERDKVVLSEIALKEDGEWKTALQAGGATVSLDFGKTLDGFAGALGCVIYYIDEIKGEDYAG